MHISIYSFIFLSLSQCGHGDSGNCKDEKRDWCKKNNRNDVYWCKVGSYKFDNCKQTCGYCNGEPIPKVNKNKCDDYEKKCKKWAINNQCALAKGFMEKYCRRSCKLCPDQEIIKTTKSTYGFCTDKARNCKDRAAKRHCYFQRGSMSRVCQSTCKMCKPGGKCLDSDSLCPYWAGLGHCNIEKYQNFMMENCKYTCVGC